MSDRRFFKKELLFCRAFCKIKNHPTVKKIIAIAKCSRSTFYRHHKNLQSMPRDTEIYLIDSYTRTIKDALSKECTNPRSIFLITMGFISGNRDFFMVLFDSGQKDIIKQMLEPLRSVLANNWGIDTRPSKFYLIYVNEILSIIEYWHQNRFSDETIDEVLRDIMQLTETAPQRLALFIK